MPGITADLLKYTLDNSNDKIFGFCYDSSHNQIAGPNNFNLLSDYKEKLFAIYLPDRIKEFVDHAIPGEGFINFSEIIIVTHNAKDKAISSHPHKHHLRWYGLRP
jgi:sugar phosphate isomerase/epimerase